MKISRRSASSQERAFELVEIIAVVANCVILIVLVVMLPWDTRDKAKAVAQKVYGTNNLKQVALGLLLFN